MIIMLLDNQMAIYENGFDAWRRNVNRFLIISTRYQLWSNPYTSTGAYQ